MAISSLVAKAQSQGIHLYVQDGQVRISLQWPVDSIPGPVRQTLAELKQRRSEILVYFALRNPVGPETLLAVLRMQGIYLTSYPDGTDTGFKIHVNHAHPNKNYSICLALLNKLSENRLTVTNYLATHPQSSAGWG